MKRYKIISIIYAKNINDAIRHYKDAEVVDVELNEELNISNGKTVGF